MENNKRNEMLIERLKKSMLTPVKGKPESGELPDEALETVSGGTTMSDIFYIARCTCGWQSIPYDNQGEYDLAVVALDHYEKRCNPNCEGDFTVFEIDSRTVILG